jgi:hypothetical protein
MANSIVTTTATRFRIAAMTHCLPPLRSPAEREIPLCVEVFRPRAAHQPHATIDGADTPTATARSGMARQDFQHVIRHADCYRPHRSRVATPVGACEERSGVRTMVASNASSTEHATDQTTYTRPCRPPGDLRCRGVRHLVSVKLGGRHLRVFWGNMSKGKKRPGFGTPRVVNIATGIELVITLPSGGIDPAFVDGVIGDLKASYQRALARSWSDFDRKHGTNYSAIKSLDEEPTKRSKRRAA